MNNPHTRRSGNMKDTGNAENGKPESFCPLSEASTTSTSSTMSTLCPKRTPNPVGGFDFDQFRDFGGTFRLGNRAAGGEAAAGREIANPRNIAGNGGKPVGVAAQLRHG